MKKFLVGTLVVVLVLACAGFFFFHSQTSSPNSDVKNYPSSGSTIIAFGDSLIQGNGSTAGNDIPALLSQGLGTTVINAGVSGETASDGLKRIDSILNQDPKIVVVLFGGNDALQRIPVDQTFSNLEQIVTKIQDKGAIVVLLGVQGNFVNDPYAVRFEALATKYKAVYVSNILAGIIDHPEYRSDEVHPNDAGYKIIAQRLAPIIQKLIQ